MEGQQGDDAMVLSLYKTKQWQAMRQRKLRIHPYCQCPHHRGKDKSAKATVVDHREPHRGDKRLFFDFSNLQSMTKLCHDKFKQSQEKGGSGFLQGCDEHGNPLSHEHSWYDSGERHD